MSSICRAVLVVAVNCIRRLMAVTALRRKQLRRTVIAVAGLVVMQGIASVQPALANEFGAAKNLQYYNTSGTLVTNWGSATNLGPAQSPSTMHWKTTDSWFDEQLNASSYSSECTGYPSEYAADQAAEPTAFDVQSPSWQSQEIKNAAAGMGDSSPTNIRTANTTYGAAVSELGGGSIGAQFAGIPAVLVTAQGQFVDSAAGVPVGHAAPSGTNLSLLFDSNTGQLLGLSVSGATPEFEGIRRLATQKTAHIAGSIQFASPPNQGAAHRKQPGTVVLRNHSRNVIARQHVRRGHGFDFTTSPGNYYLSVAKQPHCKPNKEPIASRAGSTTHVIIYCHVR